MAEQANTRARILGDETIVNQSLLNLVRIDLDRGETERAAEELAEVELRLKRVLPEGHYAFGTVSALRSTLDLDRGDADAALIAADQAVTIVESAGQGGEYLAPFLLRRVEVYLRLRQFELARADADRALLLEQQSSDPGAMSVRLGRTWMTLAHVYDGQGDGKAARAAYGTAFEHLHASLGDDHPLTREAAGKALSLERVVP